MPGGMNTHNGQGTFPGLQRRGVCLGRASPPSFLPHWRCGTKPEDWINKSADAASSFHSLPLMNNRGQPLTSSSFLSSLHVHTYRVIHENTQETKLKMEYEDRSQAEVNLWCYECILSLTSNGQRTATPVSLASNRRDIICWSTSCNMTNSLGTMTKHISFSVLRKSKQWKTMDLAPTDKRTRSFLATAFPAFTFIRAKGTSSSETPAIGLLVTEKKKRRKEKKETAAAQSYTQSIMEQQTVQNVISTLSAASFTPLSITFACNVFC